jgi:hypothetical protein
MQLSTKWKIMGPSFKQFESKNEIYHFKEINGPSSKQFKFSSAIDKNNGPPHTIPTIKTRPQRSSSSRQIYITRRIVKKGDL